MPPKEKGGEREREAWPADISRTEYGKSPAVGGRFFLPSFITTDTTVDALSYP